MDRRTLPQYFVTVFLFLFCSLLHTSGATLSLSVRIGVVLPQKVNDDQHLDNFLRSVVDEINDRDDILNSTTLNLHIIYADEGSLYQTFHKACEMFKFRAISILGSNSPQMDDVLSSTCSNFQIPYLSIRPKSDLDSPALKKFSLSLAPSMQQISSPILAMGQEFGWKKVGIVYHKDTGTLDPGKLTEYFQKLDIQPFIYELRSSDIRRGLKDLQNQEVDGYIVDIDEKYILYFFRQALESGIVHSDSTFIFTSLNILRKEKDFANQVKLTGAKIIGMSSIDREALNGKTNQNIDIEKGFYRDSIMVFAKSLEKFSSLTETTEQIDCQDPEATFDAGTDLFQRMKNVEFTGETGHISFDNITNLRRNPILHIYEMQSSGYMKKVGKWQDFRGSPLEGLTFYENPYKLTQAKEFTQEEPLRVGVIMKYGINSTEHRVNSYFDKLVFQLIAKSLVDKHKHNLNVSLHYYHPKLHYDSHKSEDRIAKFIKRKDLDLILGPFGSDDVYNFENKENMGLKVDTAVYQSPVPFLVSNMTELTINNKGEISITSILSSSPFFWLNIVGLYFISAILLFGIVRLSPYSRRAFEKSQMITILGDCFWFLLPPGLPATSHKIKTPSSRVFILTYFLFTVEVFFIIAISFVMNLQHASRASAILSFKGEKVPDDVLKIENGLYTEGRYVLPEVEWRVISKHFEQCLIEEKNTDELITYRAIFPKGSRWAANFSRVLEQLNSQGKLKSLQEKWFSKNHEEEESNHRCVGSVNNTHIDKPDILWITLGIGYVLAVIIALLEMCVYVFHAHDAHNPDHYSRSELISTEFHKIFESKDSDIHHRVGESMERSPPMQQRFLTTM
ncbi:glutamate receptor ionotropic, kainate 2 isoform X1 [Lepeophtheirus salmonis]|nr:uncharacterized protein LOC121114064 isoform X1 [Lepeophtheirus salmonis]